VSEKAKPANAGKWEVLRRLRYGDVLKLIRFRYGVNPPDDDAARPDVMELLFLASMAPAGWEEKVRNAIDLYAPWMPTDEVESLIQHLSVTPHYQKLRTAEQLGRILHLKNEDRERLKLWRIKPFDMTEEELAEQSKARERSRRSAKRRLTGIPTREARQAQFESSQKPWEALGIHRRTWERRRRAAVKVETILNRSDHECGKAVTSGRSAEGLQGSGATGRTSQVTEVSEVESQKQECLAAQRHRLRRLV
jgi:hypothetical protein